jgi:hypothetical protein
MALRYAACLLPSPAIDTPASRAYPRACAWRPLQVRSIEPGSQADKAGVLPGWHIRMINDVPIPTDQNKALAERMPVDANIGATTAVAFGCLFA